MNSPSHIMEEQTETPNDVKTQRNVTRNSQIWENGYGPRASVQ